MKKKLTLALVVCMALLLAFCTTANAAQTYVLTVVNGTGSGSYSSAQKVEISAGTVPGKVFAEWVSDGLQV